MKTPVYYAIHYLKHEEPEHFIATANAFSEVEAIRLATSHAGQGTESWIECGLPRKAILIEAAKLGITQVRWNKAG